MKILLVDDDDALLSFLAKELENRGCDVHQSSSGDEAFHVWQRLGPWELVLTDYRFFPGTKIRDGAQLAAAIHGINPHQQMALMTADPKGARGNPPQALRHIPVLRKPFTLEQVLRLLREPVLPL
jgi:CheY-like chemotaxis protein